MKSENLVPQLFVPDEEKAMDFLRHVRWPSGVYCPECKSFEVYNRGVQGKSRRYSCNSCGLNFNDLTGTVFANKKLPVGEIFYIIMNLDKKSVQRLSDELGHKWDSVYRVAHEFRESLLDKSTDPVLKGDVEIDEMYQSAGEKGLKKLSKD